MFYCQISKESGQIKYTIKYAFANGWGVITVFLRVTIVISNHVDTIRMIQNRTRVGLSKQFFFNIILLLF